MSERSLDNEISLLRPAEGGTRRSVRRQAFGIVFVVTLLVAGIQGQVVQGPSKQASLQPILEILDKAKLSASLEFSGRCESFNIEDFPEFPPFRPPTTSGGSAVEMLREMFANVPSIQVTQDATGIVRIVEKGIQTDILNVRIAHVLFGRGPSNQPWQIDNANAARIYISGAPEVRHFVQSHDIEPLVGGAISSLGPLPGAHPLPRIPGPLDDVTLDNVTLSEAMDRVLKAFPGLWIYQNCPQVENRNRMVYFRFYYLQNTGRGKIVQ